MGNYTMPNFNKFKKKNHGIGLQLQYIQPIRSGYKTFGHIQPNCQLFSLWFWEYPPNKFYSSIIQNK